MKEIKISDVLYRFKGETLGISKTTLESGSVLNDTAYWSTYRTTASSRYGAKISRIAFGLERIVLGKAMFLESDSKVYMEAEQSSGRVAALFDGSTIYSSEELSPTSLSALFLAYSTRSNSDREETIELVQRCVKEYDVEESITNELVFAVCDSAYYGSLKSFVCEEEDGGIVYPTIQKAIDSGELVLHNVFKNDAFENVTFNDYSNPFDDIPTKKTTLEEEFEGVMRGEWIIPYDWDDEVKKYIKPLDWLKDYTPTNRFFDVLERAWMSFNDAVELMDAGESPQRILSQTVFNTILSGVPGTGKSKLIAAIACAMGVPYYNFSFSQETEKGDLVGQADIDKDGVLKRVKTLLITWAQYGGVFSAEECNLCSSNLIQGIFSQLLEEPFQLTGFSGDVTYNRHPLSAFCGSMNPGTNGTFPLNEAFVSRNPAQFYIEPFGETEFVNMVEAKYAGKFSVAQIKWVYKVLTTSYDYLNQSNVQGGNYAQALCARTCFELLMQMRENPIRKRRKSPKDAINNTFIGTIHSFNEPEIAKGLATALDAALPAYPY